MKCPVCVTREMRTSDREGIVVEYCPDCRGLWLERGEIDKIVRLANNDDSEELDRVPDRIERHRKQRQAHLASERRESTRLVQSIFDF